MTTIVNIEKKITIDSQYLNSNLKNNILNKLKNITKDECSKDYGYYIDVKNFLKIKDNYISSNCENIFLIEFKAELLKPEAGKIFEGNVCMIFCGGIFLNVLNKLKVLIPISSILNYEFNSTKNTFINKKTLKTINKDDKLKVSITGTKYSKQNFSCFGVLVDD